MTMQNLDVYETFRERRVRCEFPRQFNNLGNRGPEKQRSLGAAQLARYSIDIVTRNPLGVRTGLDAEACLPLYRPCSLHSTSRKSPSTSGRCVAYTPSSSAH